MSHTPSSISTLIHPPGHVLPISRGQMRNKWFPKKIASYITIPEMRTLRLNNTIFERDFAFGAAPPPGQDSTTNPAMAPWQKDNPGDIKGMSTGEIRDASAFQKAPVVEKLSPERSMELVEIFVPKRLDFYRQPIMEEKAPEPEAVAEVSKKPKFTMGGAAGDLLAARQRNPAKDQGKKKLERQAIYGSVSVQDVLVAMRAALATNDEAARVALQEGDVVFVDLPETEEVGKVKHTGDFTVDVRVKGADTGLRRAVKVISQEM